MDDLFILMHDTVSKIGTIKSCVSMLKRGNLSHQETEKLFNIINLRAKEKLNPKVLRKKMIKHEPRYEARAIAHNMIRLELYEQFGAFHINYFAIQIKVITQLRKETGLSRTEIRIISILYGLIDDPGTTPTWDRLPNYPKIRKECYFISRMLPSYLYHLVNKGYLTMTKTKRKGGQDRLIYRYYDLDKKGVKLCMRYSELMLKYYQPNYYTEKAARQVERLRLRNLSNGIGNVEDLAPATPTKPKEDDTINNPFELFD